MTRSRALGRVAALYLLVQLFSWVILSAACYEGSRAELWGDGALGPLAAVEALPRFRYHSFTGNVFFVRWCCAVAIAPFAYVVRPGRAGLAATGVALVVWVVFGLGFSVRHV
jgi:hypothetical protein